jgi:hypothetical protein
VACARARVVQLVDRELGCEICSRGVARFESGITGRVDGWRVSVGQCWCICNTRCGVTIPGISSETKNLMQQEKEF